MARKKRYSLPGRFYHVMLRGNDAQTIFFEDADRYRMSLLIQEGVERYGHRIHAFCFMKNHIHLLIQLGITDISKIIQNITFRYTQYINKKYDRIGHLFQGRFKSILLDEEGYFLKLLRYIHRNPIRAHIVKSPSSYHWSSHNTYLGADDFLWITTKCGLSKFDNSLEVARKIYDLYVQKKESEEDLSALRNQFVDGQLLGNDNFIDEIRKRVDQSTNLKISFHEVISLTCAHFDIDETSISSSSQSRKITIARKAIARIARDYPEFTLKQAGSLINRNSSSLSRLAKEFEKKCQTDSKLQKKFYDLKEKLELATSQARPPTPAEGEKDGATWT